jgi:hypothetical protein
MKLLCKDCTHGSVCKHRFDFERTLENLDTKVPTPFTLEISCPFYSADTQKYYNIGLSDFCTTTNTIATDSSTTATLHNSTEGTIGISKEDYE